MLGAVAHLEHGQHFHVAVQRSREFAPDDIRLYQRLAPHLQRAVQLNLKLTRLEMRCAATTDALDRLEQGALLVDAASRVLFANKEAERLTGIGGGLRLAAGVLQARSTSDTAKLQALVADCGHQGEEVGAGGSLSSAARLESICDHGAGRAVAHRGAGFLPGSPPGRNHLRDRS